MPLPAGELIERGKGLHQVHVHVQRLVSHPVGPHDRQVEPPVEVLEEPAVADVRGAREQEVEEGARLLACPAVAGKQGKLGQRVDHEREAIDDFGVILDPPVLLQDPEVAAVLGVAEALEETRAFAREALELADVPPQARGEREGKEAPPLAEEGLLRLAARPPVPVVGGAEAAVFRLEDPLHPEGQKPVAQVSLGRAPGGGEPGPQVFAFHGQAISPWRRSGKPALREGAAAPTTLSLARRPVVQGSRARHAVRARGAGLWRTSSLTSRH